MNPKITQYLEGWRLGNPQFSLDATVDDFYYDDPNTGRVPRDEFVDFMESFKQYGAEISDGKVPEPFLEYTDIVSETKDDITTIWCWWRVTGTNFQGSAKIYASEKGVISERIAYFTHLPE